MKFLIFLCVNVADQRAMANQEDTDAPTSSDIKWEHGYIVDVDKLVQYK